MKPLSAALLAASAAMLAWLGARYLSVTDAFGALASRESVLSVGAARPRGAAGLAPRAAARPLTTATASSAPAKGEAIRGASSPQAQAQARASDDDALAGTARQKLAALRAPLSPEAQNDPFNVQSWLPPPPPPPAPVAEAVQAPPPVAPPLPFTYVGMSNANQAKPQVFLANGDQLLIVSPGDVVDGRYRFESIAATGAVFTYLPLQEKQVMTIEGEGN
ncbi:secretion system X translation initiation factor [Trinickia sp. EG282A]|uniref:secretion system X translation initiation factor n=1 Tax=Trinickia sp. EG282A TaxID=3237013 RepID=UPI0034D23733